MPAGKYTTYTPEIGKSKSGIAKSKKSDNKSYQAAVAYKDDMASRKKQRTSKSSGGMVPSYVGSRAVGQGLGTVEKKVVDIVYATYAVEETGTVLTLLNGCAPGSQNFNRIGRKINMKSLQIRGMIYNTDLSVGARLIRMIVVYDKQANGTAPTYANIVTSNDISGATSSTAYDMVNLNNRERFEIIRDKCWVFGPLQNTTDQSLAGDSQVACLNEFIPLKNRQTIYNAGAAGTVGDIASGSLYVFWIANTANATGSSVQCSYRMRFVDP